MKRKKYTTRNKSKKNSKQLREYIKRKKTETGVYEKRHFVKLICIKCKREYKIRVNDKSMYTDKMIRDYICILCRPAKRR